MPVLIHGKQYITVPERVRGFLDDHAESDDIGVATEVTSQDSNQVTVKATIRIAGRIFTGHAQSHANAEGIEGRAPLEVAETSAVGRALGFAGYGLVDSIASAEEVIVAQERESIRSEPADAGDPYCPTHGKGKLGNKGNYYCPTKVGDGWCRWVAWPEGKMDAQMAPDGDEVPFE